MYALALVAVILCILFKILNVNNWPTKSIFYCANQHFLDEFRKRMPSLDEPYIPTRFWGYSGHIQTIIQGVISRLNCPLVNGKRVVLKLTDGATLTYDVYPPIDLEPVTGDFTMAICPGIGNNSESVYIRRVIYNAQIKGFRVAVLNHIGTLSTVPVTSPRIFSYGNTSDYASMIKDVVRRFSRTRIVCVGFSMGGNLVTKYLGEPREKPKHILSGISVCQGYDANRSMKFLLEWENFRRLYTFIMTENMKSILRKWRKALFTEEIKNKYGFTENFIYQAGTLQELDDRYTRRIVGCKTVKEMYSKVSCVHHMKNIAVPMVYINAVDDPLVHPDLLEIVRDVALNKPNTLYIEQKFGGHLGFYEGGLFYPKPLTWMDRMVVDISTHLVQKFHNKDKMMMEDSEGELSDNEESKEYVTSSNSSDEESKEYFPGSNSSNSSVPCTPDTSSPSTPTCLTPPNTPVPLSRRYRTIPAGLNIFPHS